MVAGETGSGYFGERSFVSRDGYESNSSVNQMWPYNCYAIGLCRGAHTVSRVKFGQFGQWMGQLINDISGLAKGWGKTVSSK